MKIKIWGSRGSIPIALTSAEVRDKITAALRGAQGVDLADPLAIRAYVDSLPPMLAGTGGGNTSCVELQADNQTFAIDAGSGIHSLGLELMKGPCGRGQGVVHLFMSHTHWDHIQGFPFFRPAYIPGNRINVYSIHDVQPVFDGQMKPATFPISLDSMRANIQFISLTEGERLELGNVHVTNLRLPHPGRSYAYRFEYGGVAFVYASDSEYKYLDESHVQPYLRFFAGADVLIFDAQFSLRDAFLKEDWGHSSALIGVDLARQAGVKRLVLFHHDPTSSDADLTNILEQTIAYQAMDEAMPPLEILLGRDGLAIDLDLMGPYSLRPLPAEDAAILLVGNDFDQEALAGVIQQAQTEANESQLPRLVIDLTGVTRLNVAGLRSLVDLRRAWEGRPLALTGLAPRARQMMEMASCLDFFDVYPSVQAALEALEARETLHLPGQLIGNRYRIEAKLGESDLGLIFRAVDTRLDRVVVIKVLSPSLSQAVTQRLQRQAQKMAGLQAPNIVTLFDSDEDRGLTYLVMEYVGTQTLRHLLAQGNSGRAGTPFAIAEGILRALEYAHSRGVTHGTLKPENILIAGDVKITDFGLRWAEEGRPLIDAPPLVNTVIGSPYYLAPEQILGQPATVRTDLYALGVILYELFTGQRPFEGDGHEVLEHHLHRPPTPPRELRPELSRSLEYLILKLLAKEPEQRYADALEVRRVLLSLENAATPETVAHFRREGNRVFVGRDAQLQRLLRLWNLAQHGQGQLVMIAGEAGIGKTRLCEELAAHVQSRSNGRGATILMGRCSELEGHYPYQPFVEIGREYLTRTPLVEVEAQLGDSAAVLGALLPEVYERLPALTPPLPLEPERERQRLLHSLTRFVGQASAARPWLLILDDIHWVDPASLELLHYLARHVTTMPVLILGTYRDVELENDHPLRELMRSISRYPIYQHVALDRLGQEGVSQLLEGIWHQDVPPEWSAAIYQRTGGNPFYVEEVTKELVDEAVITLHEGSWYFPPMVSVSLPQSVRDIVLRRVSRLSAPAQEMLRLAAVIGREFHFDHLLAVSEGNEDELLHNLDEALGRDLIREIGPEALLAFSHDEIHQVIYEALRATRRRTLHRRVGVILEQRLTSNARLSQAQLAQQLAYHFIQADDAEKAFAYSLLAAQHARSLSAYETALTWYGQALTFLPQQVTHPAMMVEFYEGLGTALWRQARFNEASSTFREMQSAAEFAGDRAAQARALTGLAIVQIKQGEYPAAIENLEHGATIAEAAGADLELAGTLFRKGWAFIRLGNAQEAIALGERALALSTSINDKNMVALSLNLLGSVSNRLGQFERAESYYREGLTLLRELGDQAGEGVLLNNLGEAARRRGDYPRAIELYNEAMTLSKKTGHRDLEMMVLTNLGGARVGLADYGAAETTLRQAITLAEVEGWAGLMETYRFLAEACLGQGKLADAFKAAQHSLSLALTSHSQSFIGSAWRTLGQITGHPDFGLAMLDFGLEDTPEIQNIKSKIQNPSTCFAESLRLFTTIGMEEEQARTLRAWADYERTQGHETEAAEKASQAQSISARLGMSLGSEAVS
jgi:phosphoribosyl 1,2-cyclic phosphodiesterase/tetratricopeptide (TPR) repeat protein/anti-anti-sigma regulatory factor